MSIKGESHVDYFNITCGKCGESTKNKYLGWDPSVPHFEATCKRCGTTDIYKLSHSEWEGLPPKNSEE